MVEELKHTRYVYHYTSIDTLFAILEHYRKDKNKNSLIFRASNIYNLNDPKEMEAGYNAVKSFLNEYEKEKIPQTYWWLYEISCKKENEIKCKEDYMVGRKGYLIGTGIVPYTVSFSARRDYLPMWSLYGKTGKGVCLKFDAYKMIEKGLDAQVGFVAYDMKSKKRTMQEVISDGYKLYMDSYKNKLEKLSTDNKIKELATICLYVSPFIKYKDYKYEKEFRLVYYDYYSYDNNELDINPYSLSLPHHELKPYIEVPISSNSLKEIIIGPSMDKDSIIEIIRREIKACNLDVRVSKSKVPFRIK